MTYFPQFALKISNNMPSMTTVFVGFPWSENQQRGNCATTLERVRGSKGKFTLMTEIDHWITARGASIKGLFIWKQGVLDKNEKSLNCILLGHTAGIFSPHLFGATHVLKFMGTIFPKFAIHIFGKFVF